ncbi:MAG: ATP-dependent Clp protease ATP-binding subunit [Patescibacteria group bacterium]|nr:ATP-dependent Clp protease ATP-binding subunit [Patescibacteria group bacterium]
MLPNDLIHRFTNHLKDTLQKALSFAVSNGRDLVEPGDLIVGLLQEKGALGGEILKKAGCKDLDATAFFLGSPSVKKSVMALDLSQGVKKLLEKCIVTAHLREHKFVGTEHLVAALAECDDKTVLDYFKSQNIDLKTLREQAESVLRSTSNFPSMDQVLQRAEDEDDLTGGMEEERPMQPPFASPRNWRASQTSALESFARNLTQADIAEKLDPVIGRESEIERVIEILIRRTKSNPILLGDPGVGKTAIVEGLAKRLADGDVPDALYGHRLLSLDLASTVAGTMYRGEFEARLKQIVEEARQDPKTILFIDEIHNIVGAGSTSGSLDAANILKPALARGEIRCVGATTWSEYKKHIEPDAALERRFQPVMIEEPTAEATHDMLKGLEERYAQHHNVKFHPQTLRAAVDLAGRFMTDRLYPDKAVDLMDEAAASVVAKRQSREQMERLSVLDAAIKAKKEEAEQNVQRQEMEQAEQASADAARLEQDRLALADELDDLRLRNRPTIKPEDVAKVVARIAHVPVSVILASERERLGGLEERLSSRIIGQDDAINQVADVIRRAKLGLHDPKRPKASLLLVGPSGTGKTELARALAQELFGREDALIKLDMSEFAEPHSLSKLVGSPAGYVGYRESTKLTDAVRKRPHSVICFDEIEKAHNDVQQTLLQILEDGQLTDSTGRPISFRNAYVVLTSNVGSDQLQRKHLGFGDSTQGLQPLIQDEVKQRFKTELINRLDRIIVFNPLTSKDLRLILDRELAEICERIATVQRVACEVTESVRSWLMKQSLPAEEGARAIRRLIEREVSAPLGKHLTTKQKRSRVTIMATDKGLKFK